MPLIARTYKLPEETLRRLAVLAHLLCEPAAVPNHTAVIIEAIDRLYESEFKNKPKTRKRRVSARSVDGLR